MRHETNPKRVFEKLLEMALFRRYLVGSPDDRRVERHVRNGEEFPEDLRPGYLLTRLPPEEREVLMGFTSDMALSYRITN